MPYKIAGKVVDVLKNTVLIVGGGVGFGGKVAEEEEKEKESD